MGLPAAQLVHEHVVHDCKKPRAEIAAGTPQVALVDRPLERVLYEIIGRVRVTDERPRVAPQPRDMARDLLRAHLLAPASSRPCGHGRATRHRLSTPSPVRSPGIASLLQRYSGLPLYAHCFVPSSRATIV